MAFLGQFYHQITKNKEYVDRVFAQSKEVEETTLRGVQSCLFKNIISLEWYYPVCKRYMRIIIKFCQDMMHTGICKTLNKEVLRKIDECTSELNTELCQFVTMVKEQKNLEFERVSRLAFLLRQSLEQQQVCPRSQPFQKYMPQSQRKQCPFQMNPFSQEGYTTPQKKKWKNPHTFLSQPNNWNWEQNIQSQQKTPQNTWVRKLVVKNNLDQAQQRQSQQMHVDFNSQEQMNQRYSLRNNDWSQSKKSFEPVFQPQLQEITQHVQMLDMQNLVEVHAVPVGQGDCNIITCNKGKNVIIFDCGSIGDNIFKKKKNFEFLQSYFTNAKFVAILISHGDRDHFNMIQDILTPGVTNGKRFISILGGVRKDYKNSFYNFLNDLTNKQIKFHEGLAVGNLCQDETIYFDFIEARAAHPYAKKNEKGMLMKLSCKGCESSLLFSGDMEGKVADYLAMKTNVGKMFLSSTHYKMAHHGASDKANRVPWLRAVSPVEVHVSHMFNHGRFHHPRWEAYYRILYNCPIGTDGPQSHKFTSFRGSGKNTKVASNIWYRVYSTTPMKGEVCLISLVFSRRSEARTGYYCNDPGIFVSARILQQ